MADVLYEVFRGQVVVMSILERIPCSRDETQQLELEEAPSLGKSGRTH